MNKQQKIELLENELHTLENRILDLLKELQRKDNIINELKEELYHIYNYAGLDTNILKDKIKELENDIK